MSEQPLLKDQFGPALARELAGRVAITYPAFDGAAFVARLEGELPPLELKARVGAMAAALRDHLPAAFPEAARALVATLGPARPEGDGMFAEMWLAWPCATYVERYGLEHPEEALAALHAITQRGSAEFAIRPYILAHHELTMATLARWASDPSFHVRRLVSEGSRPRLPWAPRLAPFVADPAPVLALLERLRADSSEYVRRSVANNLNDIARDHPALAVATAARWLDDPAPTTARLVRHALRGLVKAGHPGALALLGAEAGAAVRLEGLRVEPARPAIGGRATIQAALVSEAGAPQRLVVDYVVYFAAARGAGSRRKVFKLRELELAPGERAELTWGHSFRQLSTRRHYPGAHRVELQVNGVALGGADFILTE